MSQYITERNKMNIEEAKANIGKEVVLLKNTKPYVGRSEWSKELAEVFDHNDFLVLRGLSDNGTLVDLNGYTINPKHIALKHPTFKVGDQVVLDESTKPYKAFEATLDSMSVRKIEFVHPLVVTYIGASGEVMINGSTLINSCHLNLAPQQEVKPQKSDVVDFEQNHPRLKDVTNLLQKLDVAFSVDENEIAFTVKYGDNSFQVMKQDQDALLYSEALFIASNLNKAYLVDAIMEKQTKACILLQNNGYKVNLTMRGIEVL